MRTPKFWSREKGGVLALALSPLGALYGLSVRLKHGAARPYRPRARVICVGNLTAGGTGKTPIAIALARLLQAKGRRIVFLTRGFGGRLKGPLRVEPGKHSARAVGDEPLLLASVAPTIVARDRAKGARLADTLADIIIMDDGFQNFSIEKDLSLLVIDAAQGLGNGRMIPAGPLRESPARGFARAHAAVLLGDSECALPACACSILRARIELAGGIGLSGRKVYAFAGIGRPEKFFRTLIEMDAKLADTRGFPDHYNFSRSDIERLKTRADALGAILVTTEKDYVRLDEDAREGVLSIPIRAVFDDEAAILALLDKFTP